MLRSSLSTSLLLVAALACPTGSASAQVLATELVGSGYANPLLVTAPPGDFDRIFVVEQNQGDVHIIKNGVQLATPFIDMTGSISTGSERGLLGLVFHPDYMTNGRFFLSFTDTGGDTLVQEFAASPPSSDVADPTVVQTIYAHPQPFSNHNGGHIAFGPDGMMYLGLGDGGSGNDPGNRAQNLSISLGKMLRFDVDLASPFIPADNPFVGIAGNDEIWAYGLRNPWRYSFDRGTGDLYIGDVGQNAREEVDYVPSTSTGGENYGWRCMEGLLCTGLTGCTCNDPGLTFPIHTYVNGANCSITGGYVYQGSAIPSLQGTYFFGDYCTANVWSFKVVGGVMQDFVARNELETNLGFLSSFGEDAAGEMYLVDHSDGDIFKIVECGGMQRYCTPAVPNSTGQPGVIDVTGSLVVADDDLTLTATGLPTTPNIGYFLMGTGMNTFTPPGSAGPICVAPGILRLIPPVSNTSEGPGSFLRVVGTSGPQTGSITPGSTWNFQAWHRDMAAGTSNLTDAVSVTFCN